MKKTMKAWADVGSHSGIFYFDGGDIADRYPTLLMIYKDKVASYLKEVTITYEVED
jgi:hypothetical protein